MTKQRIYESSELKLWYDEPAQIWEEALPVGNGTLGAMVFGNPTSERIQFNEETFWAGGPIGTGDPGVKNYLPGARQFIWEGKYQEAHDLINQHMIGPAQMPYLPMGDVLINMQHSNKVTNFKRELDLRTAIAQVSYTSNGVQYKREVFSSVFDNAILVRLESNRKNSLNFNVAFSSEIGAVSKVVDGQILQLKGSAPDQPDRKSELHFEARLHILENNGTTNSTDSVLQIKDASKVTLVLFAATNFKNAKNVTGSPKYMVENYRTNVGTKTYGQIRDNHITEHQRLFNRLELKLPGTSNSKLPTDERLELFKSETDPSLVALYYQYGRYLLISSSRMYSHPANLQGIWNHKVNPPWQSKYTTNINLQMNYWAAEASNLAECAVPLFTLVRGLAQTGKQTANDIWGANGWVLHHNTDIWRTTTPVDGATWGMWPTGGAMLCTHLWEHYLFSGDEDFLRIHYPAMRESARFFVESLVEHPEYGYLVTNPSLSPENRHLGKNISVVAGPSMDNQLLRDLFKYTIRSAEILNIDEDFRDILEESLERLAPDQIGSEGQLQEWLEDWDTQVPEPYHRHLSHLYGLYPGAQFTNEDTPELWNAARKSLEMRGDGGTGWSLAWKINLWARLYEGDQAFKMLKILFAPTRETGFGGLGGTYPNLFNAGPPFQIDGNLGAVAGINEMLLQSQNGKIKMLPALPSELNQGVVEGIRARGGFEFSMAWNNGELNALKILSKRGNTCNLQYRDRNVELKTIAGKRYTLNAELEIIE